MRLRYDRLASLIPVALLGTIAGVAESQSLFTDQLAPLSGTVSLLPTQVAPGAATSAAGNVSTPVVVFPIDGDFGGEIIERDTLVTVSTVSTASGSVVFPVTSLPTASGVSQPMTILNEAVTIFPAPPISPNQTRQPAAVSLGSAGQGAPAREAASVNVSTPPSFFNQGIITLPVPGPQSTTSNVTPPPVATSQEMISGRSTTNYQALTERYGTEAPAATLIPTAVTEQSARTADIATLLTQTIDNDSRIRGMFFRLGSSDANAEALRAGWMPKLETGFSTDYNILDGNSSALTLAARQRVFDFGRTNAALKTNAAQRILAGAEIEEMRITIAREFLSAYLNALSAQRGIMADEREINVLQQAVAANRRLADSGAASIIAARESEISLNAALARQTERGLTFQQEGQRLASLTNGVDVSVSSDKFESFVRQYLTGTVEECVAQGIERYAGLAVIDAQIEEAFAQLSQTEVDRLPSIDIVGRTGFEPFSQSSDRGLRKQTGISFSVDGNLFDGGVNDAQVRGQRLAIGERQRERETVRRELELDIRRAFAAVLASEQLLATQRATLDVLQDLVRARQRQADGGVGLIQDVLKAQVELVKAQNVLTDIETQYDRERVRLILRCGNRF